MRNGRLMIGGLLTGLLWWQAALPCVALIVLTATSSGQVAPETRAEDSVDAVPADRPAEPEISRDAWRARIDAARRRAKDIALDRRLHPEAYAPPPPEDPAKIASQRVLQDDSLQPGDIVSTDKGLFVFRGRPDQPRGDHDFVALPAR